MGGVWFSLLWCVRSPEGRSPGRAYHRYASMEASGKCFPHEGMPAAIEHNCKFWCECLANEVLVTQEFSK